MPSVKGGNNNPLVKGITLLIDKVDRALEDVAEQVAGEGQEVVYGFIDTRGTGRTWSRTYNGRKGSFPGRDASGQMRADVEQDTKISKNSVTASFGWLYHYEEYYGMQEGGFDHPITGKVEGMYAMHDAADLMLKRSADLLKERFRAF